MKRARLKVGRIILDSGLTMKQLSSQDDKWKYLKRHVYDDFTKDPDRYMQRLSMLFKLAESCSVDCLMLPACSFILDDTHSMGMYRRMIARIPFVSGGMLSCASPNPRSRFEETAGLWSSGRLQLDIDDECPKYFSNGRIGFLIAISSSVRKVLSENLNPGPILGKASHITYVLDMGHHQYSARYLRVLKRVREHLIEGDGGDAVVLLSFWKFYGSSSTSRWSIPKNPKGCEFRRIEIPVSPRDTTDYLDIFSFA